MTTENTDERDPCLCDMCLTYGGRSYKTVEIDGVERHVHASCLLKVERDAR